jgi:hypothetical protein
VVGCGPLCGVVWYVSPGWCCGRSWGHLPSALFNSERSRLLQRPRRHAGLAGEPGGAGAATWQLTQKPTLGCRLSPWVEPKLEEDCRIPHSIPQVFIRPNKVLYLPTTFIEAAFGGGGADPAAALPLDAALVVDADGAHVDGEAHAVTLKAVPRAGEWVRGRVVLERMVGA